MRVFYTNRAARELGNLPRPAQKRIVQKMRFYAEQNDPLKFAKRLSSFREGNFRFRVGDYRLLFDAGKDVIYVLKVEKRDKSYD